MKKLIEFLLGLILLGLMCVSLMLVSAIYDAGSKHTIDTMFFQTNNLSSMRLGVPAKVSDIGDAGMRRMLIKKFVNEYFYALPDAENIAVRIQGRTALAQLSSAEVFSEWKNGEAEVIQELAENKSLRTVEVKNPNTITKPDGSDYWVVEYELKTWDKPNDMNQVPKITSGLMYLDIIPESGLIEIRESVNVSKYLEAGLDAAALFKFMVVNMELQ